MATDLRPVEELDLDEDVRAAVEDVYCANCTHVELRPDEDGGGAYCTRWSEPTEVEPGLACPEYLPQGFEHLDS